MSPWTRTDIGGAGSTTSVAYLDQYVGNLEVKGPRPWVDVRAYGALGNGTTDDTTAFTNALAALDTSYGLGQGGVARKGGILFVPRGEYRVSNVTLPKDIIILGGLGYQGELEDVGKGSIIVAGSATNPSFVAKNAVTFRGLSFESYQGANGLHVKVHDAVAGDDQAGSVAFEDCSFQGGNTAVQLIGFGNLLFSKCYFLSLYSDIIILGGGTLTSFAFKAIRFKDCWVNANSVVGYTAKKFVAISGAGNTVNHLLAEDCDFINFRQTTSLVFDISGNNNQIRRCMFDNINQASSVGIQHGSGSGLVVKNNWFNAVLKAVKLTGPTLCDVGPNYFVGVTTPYDIDAASTGLFFDGTLFVGGVYRSGVTSGQIVLPNNRNVLATNGAGTGVYELVGGNATDEVVLAPAGGDIKWGKALVALGGGAAPTLGTIGGSGPATTGQNAWMRVVDSTGAAFWVPIWK